MFVDYPKKGSLPVFVVGGLILLLIGLERFAEGGNLLILQNQPANCLETRNL